VPRAQCVARCRRPPPGRHGQTPRVRSGQCFRTFVRHSCGPFVFGLPREGRWAPSAANVDVEGEVEVPAVLGQVMISGAADSRPPVSSDRTCPPGRNPRLSMNAETVALIAFLGTSVA
jgi:hypothetical protein